MRSLRSEPFHTSPGGPRLEDYEQRLNRFLNAMEITTEAGAFAAIGIKLLVRELLALSASGAADASLSTEESA